MSLELPITWKDYYVLVKEPELVSKALEHGWNNFVLFERDDFTEEDIDEIVRAHRNIIKFHLDPNNQRGFEYLNRVRDLDLYITSYNPYGLYKYNDEKVESFADVIDNLPRIVNLMELRMFREGLLWCDDYDDRCGNCQMMLESGDRYCRNCGTERGKGKFSPYRISFTHSPVLYGAPIIKKKFKCPDCGNTWATYNEDSRHCPNCGNKMVVKI